MTLLSTSGLSYVVAGRSLVDGVDLHLNSGELLGLIGPNGAGKSTLLKLLGGLLRPDDGAIGFEGRPLQESTPKERARRIAYLSQQGEVHWPISVERLVALGRLPHLGPWESPGSADQAVIEKVLSETDCVTLRHRAVTTLSGGERARALLARALAVEPRLLLADEPVAALDPAHQIEVMELLRRHCTQGAAGVVVLHDLRLAAHYCDRLQLLDQGTSIAEGRPEEVLNWENLLNVYGIRPRAGVIPEALFSMGWERA